MLHVLLVILKVAGIVILSILLVLLLLLILVLFVPIRYRVYAEKKTEVYAKASASWLFHIVHFSLYYDSSGTKQELRVFGIPTDKLKEFIYKIKSIFKFKKTKNKKSKNNKTKRSSGNVRNKQSESVTFEDNQSKEINKKPMLETNKSEETEQDLLNSKDNSLENEIAQKAMTKKGKKNHRFNIKTWFRSIKNKIKIFFKKIKKIFKKVILTCENANDRFNDVKLIVQDERNKMAFGVCKEQLIVVLKHIKPKKYKGDLKFGTGDPSLTGQILGILGMLMPVYKNNTHIIPDFENVILEGDIYMQGQVTLAKILLIAWKLYRDKNVKRCYKMIMD